MVRNIQYSLYDINVKTRGLFQVGLKKHNIIMLNNTIAGRLTLSLLIDNYMECKSLHPPLFLSGKMYLVLLVFY